MEGLGIGCGNGGGSSRCSVFSDEDALSDGVFGAAVAALVVLV